MLRTKAIVLQKECKQCGKNFRILVYNDELEMYKRGQLIQYAFSRLTPDQRELFFCSGICGTCFDELFKEEE